MDNLRRQKKILVNTCPICLADEEIVDNISLNCKIVKGLWSVVLSWFDCGCVLPRMSYGPFEAWHLVVGLDQIMWMICHAPRLGRILTRSIERKNLGQLKFFHLITFVAPIPGGSNFAMRL